MSDQTPEFRPYHEGLLAFLEEMDSLGDDFLKQLNVIAILAQGLNVPKDHRASVAAAFAKQATELRETTHWPEDNAEAVALECEGVVTAMDAQDAKDAGEQRARRWTQFGY